MFDGFVKVAAGTPKIKIADCGYNKNAVIGVMKEAAERGVKILVLPELCITGYGCQDLFFQSTLLESALEALNKIVEFSAGFDMLTTVGCPLTVRGKLYNCAVVIKSGKVL